MPRVCDQVCISARCAKNERSVKKSRSVGLGSGVVFFSLKRKDFFELFFD